MHLTILPYPSGKILSLIVEPDRPVDLVEALPEVEQSLEVIQPRVGTQVPVFLLDQHTAPSTLCVLCPNSLDPRMCIVPVPPRVLALSEKVLCHFLS